MKKTIFIYAIIFFLNNISFGQVPEWPWAKSAGGSDSDYGESICTDAQGNVYVAGYFESPTIFFDTITFVNFYYYYTDLFLVKYDNDGNVLWARNAGRVANDECYGVCTDSDGNVFITGKFDSPTITFGSFTLTNSGSYDIFLVKYDSTGNVLWAGRPNGSSIDEGYGVSTDISGNIYVTGIFKGTTITFDTIVLTNNNPGYSDIFIVKLDCNGNVIWAKNAGGSDDDIGISVNSSVDGCVYITGCYKSPTITFDSCTLTNNGYQNIFLVKYNCNGNVLWAKSAGGNNWDISESVSTDTIGNGYITGSFRSPTITFGSHTLTNLDASGNSTDVFLVKYDSIGNVLWAKKGGYGANCYERGHGVRTDSNGNIYITGYFGGPSITFDSWTLTNADGFRDVFIVKYNGNGNVLWARRAGGTGDDNGTSISTDTAGNVFITGSFQSPNITFGTNILPNNGDYDMFIAKHSDIITGIFEPFGTESEINIYPNPTNNKIIIESPPNTYLEILNITGQIFITLCSKDLMQTVNLEDLASGIYILKAKTDKGIVTKKIIKE